MPLVKRTQHVTIQLRSTIEDLGEEEIHTTKHKGRYFHKDHLDILLFEEDLEGEKVNNFITIYPDKVNINRSGVISMNQRFEVNRKTETYYQHQHGQFYMETHTQRIDYQSLRMYDIGKLIIAYTVTLNGAVERNHVLELTYQKEGV